MTELKDISNNSEFKVPEGYFPKKQVELKSIAQPQKSNRKKWLVAASVILILGSYFLIPNQTDNPTELHTATLSADDYTLEEMLPYLEEVEYPDYALEDISDETINEFLLNEDVDLGLILEGEELDFCIDC